MNNSWTFTAREAFVCALLDEHADQEDLSYTGHRVHWAVTYGLLVGMAPGPLTARLYANQKLMDEGITDWSHA